MSEFRHTQGGSPVPARIVEREKAVLDRQTVTALRQRLTRWSTRQKRAAPVLETSGATAVDPTFEAKISPCMAAREVVSLAQHAEDAGFDRLGVGCGWTRA